MERKITLLFLRLAVIVAVFAAGMFTQGHINARRQQVAHTVDTLSILRTMVDSDAIVAARTPKGYELTPVGSLDSLKRLAQRPERIREVEKPVLVVRDSVVYIHVPMEQKVFTGSKDSVDYTVTTTGYNVSLDAVSFRYPERTIHETTTVYQKQKRVALGVTAGPAVVVTPKGNVHGGIGGAVGVTINF